MGSLILFGWIGGEIREGDALAFDESVRNSIHGLASPLATSFFVLVSFVGSPLFLTILACIVLPAFLYLKYRREAAVFLITMAGEIVIETSLKFGYSRVRPEAFFDYPLPSSYSFPSGHAFGSVCFYGVVAWCIARHVESRGAKVAIIGAAALLAFLIGLSRVYLGVHYPTDVLAGFIGGLTWLGLVVSNSFRTHPE